MPASSPRVPSAARRLLDPDFLSLPAGSVQGQLDRVRREVLFQAKMGPSLSVAYLYRVFEDEDAVYMVMELCAGGPMWNRIRDEGGHYTEARAATMLRAALQAVAQCHARGIILRDVKPHNFLFLSAAEDSPLKVKRRGIRLGL